MDTLKKQCVDDWNKARRGSIFLQSHAFDETARLKVFSDLARVHLTWLCLEDRDAFFQQESTLARSIAVGKDEPYVVLLHSGFMMPLFDLVGSRERW